MGVNQHGGWLLCWLQGTVCRIVLRANVPCYIPWAAAMASAPQIPCPLASSYMPFSWLIVNQHSLQRSKRNQNGQNESARNKICVQAYSHVVVFWTSLHSAKAVGVVWSAENWEIGKSLVSILFFFPKQCLGLLWGPHILGGAIDFHFWCHCLALRGKFPILSFLQERRFRWPHRVTRCWVQQELCRGCSPVEVLHGDPWL